MQNIIVSIILPVFNSEEYIEDCLNSLINQTFTSFEIIIIDDYSTDKTIEVINRFEDNRIKIIENLGSKGISSCLNQGISIARGVYIARMDADDISLPNRISLQVRLLDNNPNIDVVGTGFKEFGMCSSMNCIELDHDGVCNGLLKGSIICHPTVMIRSEVFRKCNYLEDYNSAEDYKLWIDMIREGVNFYIVKEITLLKRAHDFRISKRKRDRQVLLSDIIRREYFAYKFNFLTSEELDIICLKSSNKNINSAKFLFILSKIRKFSSDFDNAQKQVKIIFKDTIYRVNPRFTLLDFIIIMSSRYPYVTLNILDILRIFKNVICGKYGKHE